MNKQLFLLGALVALLLSACTKDQQQPEPQPASQFKIFETHTAAGKTLSLWSDEAQVHTGFVPLYLRYTQTEKEPISGARIRLLPVMHMHDMEHGAPAVQPVFRQASGLYEGAVVFTMPSSETEKWRLLIEVDEETFEVEIPVSQSPRRQVDTRLGSDGRSYVVSLPPHRWTQGVNDFAIFIHASEDGHHFEGVSDLEVGFTPEMPSMGHGSPNNVHPLSKGSGRYEGKVNLTMTGDWRFHFELKRMGTLLVEDSFVEITF